MRIRILYEHHPNSVNFNPDPVNYKLTINFTPEPVNYQLPINFNQLPVNFNPDPQPWLYLSVPLELVLALLDHRSQLLVLVHPLQHKDGLQIENRHRD